MFFDMVFTLVLMASVAALTFSLRPEVASADGGQDRAMANATFTKWATSEPANPPSFAGVDMAGVVGGDVGPGHYAGKVLGDDLTVPGFWLGHARYEFYGKEHSFVADLHITENDTTNPATAVINGVVIEGWLKGSPVTGEYTVMDPCPIATPGNALGTLCFQGTLHIRRGDRD